MKLVIIGCTHAGISAIKQVLKYYPEVEITVYERHASISYLSCATYLHIGGSVENLDDALYADPQEFTSLGVNMKMQHDVIEIDAKNHSILVQDMQTKELFHDHYDKLIMASGSRTTLPIITGIENPKVMLCKTLNQAIKLEKAAKNHRNIAILGGGYAGVELAEGFAKSGHQVLLLQRNKYLLDEYMDAKMAEKVKSLLKNHNIKVVTDANVVRFEDTDDGRVKISTANESYVSEMVAICPGVLPQSDLLKGQVKLAQNGAILTNEYMESSDPDILAAGDVTNIHFNLTDGPMYVPLASHAIRQGNLAGMNLLKHRLRSIGSQATTGMQIFDQIIACTGLTYLKAKAAGFDAQHVFFHNNYRPAFMPTNTEISIELIYDRKTRKVLGAQLMSAHEISQSANTISVIIQNGNTIDELAYVDMLFQPNFDEPFNYLNLVAQMAVDKEFDYKQANK